MKEYLCIEDGEKFIIEAKDWFIPLILDDMISNLMQDDILLAVLYDTFSGNVYIHRL